MKKLVLVLAIALMCSASFAAVTLTESGKTGTTVTVGYSYDSAGGFPRAFGLTLTATGGTIQSVTPYLQGVSTSAKRGYGIFPGQIVINGTTGQVIDYNSPVEKATYAGATGTGIGQATAIVALGALYSPDANKPANSGALFTVVCSSGTTALSVGEEDTYRGGVVDVNGVGLTVATLNITFAVAETITGTPVVAKTTAAPAIAGRVNAVRSESFTATGVAGSLGGALEYQFNWGDGSALVWNASATQTHTFATATTSAWTTNVTVQARLAAAPATLSAVSAAIAETGEALKSTAPEYAVWAQFSRPNCWAFQRQCKGDINGTIQGSYWVYTQDLALLKAAYGVQTLPSGGICADINHAIQGSYRVYTQDLATLRSNFGIQGVTVCDSANYNFWTN